LYRDSEKNKIRNKKEGFIKKPSQEIKNTIGRDGAFEFFHNQAANR